MNQGTRRAAAATALAALCSAAALAQAVQGQPQAAQQATRPATQQATQQASPSAAPAAPPAQVAITDVVVSGNTLLPQAAIDAAVQPYKGQRTVEELTRAARDVQELYRRAGYGAVVAYLPEQKLSAGTLQIAVLEGKVKRIVVTGNQQFDTANIRRALPALQEGQTPRVQAIDAQVQLANENPARRLAVTLEEGAQRGEVDARITVIEEATSRWNVFADNTGNAQTGRLRLGAGYQNSALWGLDHQVTAQVQIAPENASDVQVFNASYRIPLYAAGLMLQAYGTYSNIDAGSTATAAGALQFNGRGRVFGVLATRLFERWGEFEQRVSLSFDKRDYLNNCAIEGLPAGACGSAGESVTVHPLTLEYATVRTGERPAGMNLSLSYNLGLGGHYGEEGNFEAVRLGAERHYTVGRLSSFAAWPLGADWRVNARLSAQATHAALVPGEQFGLTGAYVVRGYQEREITGDNGIAATLEVLTPLLLAPAERSGTFWDGLRVVAFADGGVVSNKRELACNLTNTRCHASAAGLGLRFNLWASSWRLDVATALNDARQTQRGDVRLHFQASVAFQ